MKYKREPARVLKLGDRFKFVSKGARVHRAHWKVSRINQDDTLLVSFGTHSKTIDPDLLINVCIPKPKLPKGIGETSHDQLKMLQLNGGEQSQSDLGISIYNMKRLINLDYLALGKLTCTSGLRITLTDKAIKFLNTQNQ